MGGFSRSRVGWTVLVCLVAAATALIAPAAQGHTHSARDAGAAAGVPASVERVLGPHTSVTASGLYRVRLQDGDTVLTHGPDPKAEFAGPAETFSPGDPERPPACATDYYQHVIYAYVIGQPDRSSQVVSEIQTAMRQADAALNTNSLLSGGPTADYKVLCDPGGQIKVDTLMVTPSTTSIFSDTVSAAEAVGFDARSQDYTIFLDATDPSACGLGTLIPDETLSADNHSNNPTGLSHSYSGYAVIFRDCWGAHVVMHENGHNEGAVQYGAPHSTGNGGHCYDEQDIMCYSPDGGDLNQGGTALLCNDLEHFDCGYDDYFDSAPEPGEWLSSHWNIGSSLNHFIAFGGGAQGLPPKASFTQSCVALTCSFTDTSTDDGSIASWSWNFGDGTTSTQRNSSHTFPGTGTYQVSLQVTDDTGQTNTATASVTVVAGVQRLLNGVGAHGLSAARAGWNRYTFSVPHNRSLLRVTLDGPACTRTGRDCIPELDLYVRRGLDPSPRAWQCRPFLLGPDETCTIRNPRSGSWHIGVLNANAPLATPFTVKATARR